MDNLIKEQRVTTDTKLLTSEKAATDYFNLDTTGDAWTVLTNACHNHVKVDYRNRTKEEIRKEKTSLSSPLRYYLDGDVEGSKGKLKRDGIVGRDIKNRQIVTLDLDSGNHAQDDLQKRLKGYEYILTPTPSYKTGDRRWRVIMPLDEHCSIGDYASLVEQVASMFNVDIDNTCASPAHLQGFPLAVTISDGDIVKPIHVEGVPLSTNALMESALKKQMRVKESPLALHGNVKGVLSVDGEFEQALREYAERMRDKLYDPEYGSDLWRNTLMSLRKTLKEGRIDLGEAHNVIRVLWADNAALARDNIDKFNILGENIKMDKHIDEWIALNDSDIAYYSQQSNAEWVKYDKNGTRRLLHDVLGDVLINEHHIVHYPTMDSSLYFYNASTGCYVEDARGKYIEGLIREKQRDAKQNFIREVRYYLEQTAAVIPSTSQTHIALGNCLWNFTTNEAVEFTPNEFVISKIPTNYNPTASSDFVDTFLNKITQGHEPSKQNLIELLANVVYPTVLIDRMWFLYGASAGNGKSTFLQMLTNAFSPDRSRISSVPPKKLATNNFAASDMYGKIANLVDDLPDEYIEDAGALKSIVSGQAIRIERKGEDGFSGVITAPLIFGSNHFPRFRENGNSIMRRMMIIPFDYDFMSDGEALSVSKLNNMLRSNEVREYVLKLALEGVKQVNDNNGKPTPNKRVEKALNSFETTNDPLGTYLKDLNAQDIIKRNVGSKLLYAEYTNWCDDMGIDNPVGQRRFIQRVKEVLGIEPKLVKISGKPVRVFR